MKTPMVLKYSRKLWPPKRGGTGGFLRCLAPRPAALALLTNSRKLWQPKRGGTGGFLRCLAPRPAALALSIALSVPLLAQQGFDFKSLDRLDALTNKKTKVTLDGDMLRLAAKFLGGDTGGKDDKDVEALKSLVGNLKGVYVRTYEFDKDGQYRPADIEPLRAYLKQQQWSKIVESQDDKELSEVYIQPLSGDRFGGVAILSTEPRELTVVYISGVMNIADLAKLSGNLGVPEIDLKSAKKPAANPKKEDDRQ